MADVSPIHAQLLQVLLWYDEPQIVLLQHQPFQFIVAVAIEDEERSCAFVGAQISIRQLVDYKLEKIDLRYLFMRPDMKKWWLIDIDYDKDKIPLKRLKASDPRIDDNVPETGFFSRFHEEIKIADVEVVNSVQKFDIDGSWELGEFSQFYGQVEDIYYLLHSVDEYKKSGASDQRKRQIEDALVRPFKGGGSYVGMYNDFANDNDRAAKLRVSGIQYHSPGYVEVRALEKPFCKSIDLLASFAEDRDRIKSAYNALHKTLANNRLLKKESYIRGTELRDLVEKQSMALSNELPGIYFTDFLKMTGEDLLVSSKVLLSVVRRIERLFQFFDEGRAKHPGIMLK